MSNSLKITVLSAFALVAAGSIADAAQPHGKLHALSQGGNSGQHSFRPFKHQSGSNGTSGMQTSGSHKVVVAHCDPGPCKGTTKPPPVITHCDPGPCKGVPGKETHHRPPHWPPFGHHHPHVEYRERYVEGYRPGSYERPSYAAYAPAPAAQVPATSCLSKEYLVNGPVLFKDTCTKEWAMGEASSTRGLNVGCLRKEYVDGGLVKFTDICTKEWATNAPAGQQAKAPPAAQDDDD
jgi:hypothetical protein